MQNTQTLAAAARTSSKETDFAAALDPDVFGSAGLAAGAGGGLAAAAAPLAPALPVLINVDPFPAAFLAFRFHI